jgi:hypothetical protein
LPGESFILTLQLDQRADPYYQDLRLRYYPPERNIVPAHVTLFHRLPDNDHVWEAIRETALATACFQLAKPVSRSIGRGVAVFFESSAAVKLRNGLSLQLDSYLIEQDRQRFQPHIVLQNKSDSATARLTLAEIKGENLLEPWARGMTLWRYQNGPWEHACDFPFGLSSD